MQASPRDTRPEEVDPVILLRMSERDWLSVLSDLNSEKVMMMMMMMMDKYNVFYGVFRSKRRVLVMLTTLTDSSRPVLSTLTLSRR